MPSVRKNYRNAPNTMAQIRTVPKSVPATREEIISPAPTPVTAMTTPGPTSLRRYPHVPGARSVPPAGLSVTSDIRLLPHSPPNATAYYTTMCLPWQTQANSGITSWAKRSTRSGS